MQASTPSTYLTPSPFLGRQSAKLASIISSAELILSNRQLYLRKRHQPTSIPLSLAFWITVLTYPLLFDRL
ncbi:hypothetical protein OIU78_006389 [Salix suchowensis]|nr:hypothetical protein OIU78_006389 [Salix suchowensis]